MAKLFRPDRDGTHRTQFDRNKKKIYATQTVCGICGKPVDFSLKYPHPLSACVDHIIPVAKGGHPSDLENLQLAHWTCNGICGKPVDFSLKYPHPLSACVDHIIPVAKGGHPSDLENLQLAHWTCNRQKSDKLIETKGTQVEEVISNRVLPHTFDWKNIRKEGAYHP